MNILADLHCHTLASTHAYSTVKELADMAAELGMEAIAITDHAPAIPDSPHLWHFDNLRNIPRTINGVKILYGAELNIVDDAGNTDLPDATLKKLDIVVASIHDVCFGGTKGRSDYADMYISVLENPYVDIIGHSGAHNYPYSHDDVVLKAKNEHKLIEINAHSFFARPSSISNCREIALACKKHGTGICVDSDAHICYDLGQYSPALDMLRELEFPEELIINRNLDSLRTYLAPRKHLNF